MVFFPPPTLDRNLGTAQYNITPYAPPTPADPNGPAPVVDLLNEDLAAAGGNDASPIRNARTNGENGLLDVISIGGSMLLFRELLSNARSSNTARQIANNDYWQRLQTIVPSLTASEIAQMRTQFGPDFDWTEIDWATFGRAIGSAIGEILRSAPYSHRPNTGNSDFDISWRFHDELRSQEQDLATRLGMGYVPGMRLPNTAIERAIETHADATKSSTEASMLRAGTSSSTPVFLNATFGRVNPSVGAIRVYLNTYPYGTGAGTSIGSSTPAESTLDLLGRVLEDLSVSAADYIDVLLVINGITARHAHRSSSRQQRIGFHPMAWMLNRFFSRNVDHLCLQDYVSSQSGDSAYPLYAVFHILYVRGIIGLGTVSPP
jgi:hypothetical protein